MKIIWVYLKDNALTLMNVFTKYVHSYRGMELELEGQTLPFRRSPLHSLLCSFPSCQPLFTRVDTVTAFQWRIRNLPYPLENYKVTVDDSKDGITIRTVNKK